jgi:hypothetical protein
VAIFKIMCGTSASAYLFLSQEQGQVREFIARCSIEQQGPLTAATRGNAAAAVYVRLGGAEKTGLRARQKVLDEALALSCTLKLQLIRPSRLASCVLCKRWCVSRARALSATQMRGIYANGR